MKQPAMPVIGFLQSGSASAFQQQLAAFRHGLKEGGHLEGQNIAIEFAGAKINMVGCRHWPPSWFVAASRRS